MQQNTKGETLIIPILGDSNKWRLADEVRIAQSLAEKLAWIVTQRSNELSRTLRIPEGLEPRLLPGGARRHLQLLLRKEQEVNEKVVVLTAEDGMARYAHNFIVQYGFPLQWSVHLSVETRVTNVLQTAKLVTVATIYRPSVNSEPWPLHPVSSGVKDFLEKEGEVITHLAWGNLMVRCVGEKRIYRLWP